jgi:GT2 family glycosyltransferase
MDYTFKASVIIPTFKRPELLRNLLASLAGQETPYSFEVVVVNDAPDDDLSALKVEFSDITLRLVNLAEHQGPALARNTGVENSSGEILIFLDDDTTVNEKFITGHIEAHTSPTTAVVGNVHTIPEHRSALLARYIERQGAKKRRDRNNLPPVCFRSGNASVSREMFMQAGGFDESLKTYGEDMDLAMKLASAGATFVFAEDAVAYNHSLPSVEELMVKLREWGRYTLPISAKRHPAFARHLWLHLAEPVRIGKESLLVSFKKLALRVLLARPFYALARGIIRLSWLGPLLFPVLDYMRLYNYSTAYRQACLAAGVATADSPASDSV